jgi:rod shape-determining protein MreC
VTPLKRYRDIAIVLLLLAVPFFFLRANIRAPENVSALDRGVLRVSAPIEFGAANLARGTSNLLQNYFYLVDVKGDNERLTFENARLRESIRRLEQREAENRELRRLLQLRETTGGESVSAQVTAKDFNEFFRVTRVVLDRGSRNVRAHLPVVAPDGVVGSVVSVAGDAVNVQLAVDAGFALDVEDARTGARALVRGTGDPTRYACKIEMVAPGDEVELGDLLVTSGKGKWFPRGLAVARVSKVTRRELGQEVEAQPTVNFSRLEHVLILVTPARDEDTAAGKPAAPKGR